MNRHAVKTIRMIRSSCLGIFTALVFMGCSPQSADQQNALSRASGKVTVPVVFSAQGNALNCKQGVTIDDQNWRTEHLAFYVSNLMFKTTTESNWQPLRLLVNNWQTEQTGLIWFNSQCDKSETAFNHSLDLDVTEDTWENVTALKFELAVPFEQNHLNPLQQASPLNISAMFWSWQLGHKFIRLDLVNETHVEGQRNSWSYHLGSVGCQSASSLRSPEQPCSVPNRFEITLPKTTTDVALRFDIAQLLNKISPASMHSCMFQNIQEVACPKLASNLKSGDVFTLMPLVPTLND